MLCVLSRDDIDQSGVVPSVIVVAATQSTQSTQHSAGKQSLTQFLTTLASAVSAPQCSSRVVCDAVVTHCDTVVLWWWWKLSLPTNDSAL